MDVEKATMIMMTREAVSKPEGGDQSCFCSYLGWSV